MREVSVVQAIASFKKCGVVRTPPSPLLNMWFPEDPRYNRSIYALPNLISIETHSSTLALSLVSYRDLQTLLLDTFIDPRDVLEFLRGLRSGHSLERLKSFVASTIVGLTYPLLTLMTRAFPNLQHAGFYWGGPMLLREDSIDDDEELAFDTVIGLTCVSATKVFNDDSRVEVFDRSAFLIPSQHPRTCYPPFAL